jgi:hypothetical protein
MAHHRLQTKLIGLEHAIENDADRLSDNRPAAIGKDLTKFLKMQTDAAIWFGDQFNVIIEVFRALCAALRDQLNPAAHRFGTLLEELKRPELGELRRNLWFRVEQ